MAIQGSRASLLRQNVHSLTTHFDFTIHLSSAGSSFSPTGISTLRSTLPRREAYLPQPIFQLYDRVCGNRDPNRKVELFFLKEQKLFLQKE